MKQASPVRQQKQGVPQDAQCFEPRLSKACKHACNCSLAGCSQTTASDAPQSFCEMDVENSAAGRTKLCIILVSNYLKFQIFPASCS